MAFNVNLVSFFFLSPTDSTSGKIYDKMATFYWPIVSQTVDRSDTAVAFPVPPTDRPPVIRKRQQQIDVNDNDLCAGRLAVSAPFDLALGTRCIPPQVRGRTAVSTTAAAVVFSKPPTRVATQLGVYLGVVRKCFPRQVTGILEVRLQ